MDLSTSVSVPPVSTKRDTFLQSRVTSWQTKGVGSYIAYSGKLKKNQTLNTNHFYNHDVHGF